MRKIFVCMMLFLIISFGIYSSSFTLVNGDNYIKLEKGEFYYRYSNFSYRKEIFTDLIIDNRSYKTFTFRYNNLRLYNIKSRYFGLSYKYKYFYFSIYASLTNNDLPDCYYINYDTLALEKGFISTYRFNYSNKPFYFKCNFNISYDCYKGFGFAYFNLITYHNDKIQLSFEQRGSTKVQNSFEYINDALSYKYKVKFYYTRLDVKFKFILNNTKLFMSLENDTIILTNRYYAVNFKVGNSRIIFGSKEYSIESNINAALKFKFSYCNRKELMLKLKYEKDNVKASLLFSKNKIDLAIEVSY